MKLNFILLFCLTGLVSVAFLQNVPHVYELIMTKATWPVAQNYCRAMHTDLAIIINDTDWPRLNKEAASKQLPATTPTWVGLWNDINSWRWSLGNLPLISVGFSRWCGGQPNNMGGKESCGIIGSGNCSWDEDCTGQRPFICYSANFTGPEKFIGIASPWLTWFQARVYCRTHYTDLASSLNSSDNEVLGLIQYTQGYSWIGLYRDTWKWSDGSNATDIPWALGKPDNRYGEQNCAVLNNGQFSDSSCTDSNYFFCYYTPQIKKQIVRLQVESDLSLFDATVQSSILDHINKKLKGNSMLENTTVAWRMQSDGNIFYKEKGGKTVGQD